MLTLAQPLAIIKRCQWMNRDDVMVVGGLVLFNASTSRRNKSELLKQQKESRSHKRIGRIASNSCGPRACRQASGQSKTKPSADIQAIRILSAAEAIVSAFTVKTIRAEAAWIETAARLNSHTAIDAS